MAKEKPEDSVDVNQAGRESQSVTSNKAFSFQASLSEVTLKRWAPAISFTL
jgi:hypothetical protein